MHKTINIEYDFLANQLRDSTLSSSKKRKLLDDLFPILFSEKCWNKINNPTFIPDFMSTQEKINIFKDHNALFNEAFGVPEQFKVFSINHDLIDELAGYLLTVNPIKWTDIEKRPSNILFLTFFKNKNTMTQLDKSMIIFDIKMNRIIQKLHDEIRVAISTYINSPFSFVNTRAWFIKPNSSVFGPNAKHVDGFLPGHYKILIYLTPLSKNFGNVWIDDEFITNKPCGTCLIFKNSDLRHCGISGKKHLRLCVEITIFRTLVNVKQFHDGHPNGRHYLDVSTPYLHVANEASKNATQ